MQNTVQAGEFLYQQSEAAATSELQKRNGCIKRAIPNERKFRSGEAVMQRPWPPAVKYMSVPLIRGGPLCTAGSEEAN
jgi:hypothetical protein